VFSVFRDHDLLYRAGKGSVLANPFLERHGSRSAESVKKCSPRFDFNDLIKIESLDKINNFLTDSALRTPRSVFSTMPSRTTLRRTEVPDRFP
jgi:hypothetical protein